MQSQKEIPYVGECQYLSFPGGGAGETIIPWLLYAALKEECCFYVNYSGVIRDSMAKLRERLNQRWKERESQQSWFKGWFNSSPWLTTLISTLLGPLLILLLLLTFGPGILNHLLRFIKERLSITQALVFIQQYQALKLQEGP